MDKISAAECIKRRQSCANAFDTILAMLKFELKREGTINGDIFINNIPVKITDAYNFSFKNENNALVKELP